MTQFNIKTIGIQEVAKKAGVSTITVSRVFSGKAPVAARTRDRVMAIAREFGYAPNPLAQGLRGGQTRTIGLLWSMAGSPEATAVARNLAVLAQQRSYVAYMIDSMGKTDVICQTLREFARRQVDGIILQASPSMFHAAPELRDMLRRFAAAVIVTNEPIEGLQDQIVHDRYAAYREVARHLAQAGRKRPAIMTDPSSNTDKIDVFLDELRKNNLKVDNAHNVIPISLSRKPHISSDFYKHLCDQFADDLFPFDAVMCTTDEGATALMAWLKQRELRVPDDVAVVGCDNTGFSPYLDPPLATIDRRDDEMVQMVDQLLFERIEHPTQPAASMPLAMRFLKRASAG